MRDGMGNERLRDGPYDLGPHVRIPVILNAHSVRS